jgi:hypothetical protein
MDSFVRERAKPSSPIESPAGTTTDDAEKAGGGGGCPSADRQQTSHCSITNTSRKTATICGHAIAARRVEAVDITSLIILIDCLVGYVLRKVINIPKH